MHEEILKQDTRTAFKQETLFKPASWQTKIDFINHLVLFNNVLIAVLAEKEGGKTSFVRLLQENLDSQIKSCVFTAETPYDNNELINQIANALHLRNEENFPLTMASVVKQINERKAVVLLIIDNAQNVSEAWVKDALQEIQQQKENCYFHLCLISDFSVVATYNSLAKEDTQNTIHSIELGTLNENETKTYTLHKGVFVNKVYNDEQLNHLYKMTGGCVAKINNHLLSTKSVLSLGSRNYVSNIKRSCIAASIVAIAGGVSWMTWTSTKHSETLEQVAKVAVENFQSPILLSQIPNWHEGNRQFVYQELPKEQVLAMLDERDLHTDNLTVVDKIVVIPTININKVVNVSKQNLTSYINPIEIKTVIANNERKSGGGYTIQLIASHQISDIHKFIRQNDLDGKCSIRMVNRQNDSWYILTIGEYQTSAQANNAVRDLSTKFSRIKPWVRLTSNLKLVG